MEGIASFMSRFPVVTNAPVWVPPPLPSAEKPVLFIYPRSQQRTTSQEAESIRMQALLKFASYPHLVIESHEDNISPSGELPFLLTADGKVLAGREIVEEVSVYAADKLDLAHSGDSLALATLAEAKLKFALIYALCEAKSALAALSAQLDNKLYFFGAKPTLADATIFAYLHVIMSTLNSPLADAHLRDLVVKHENLVQVFYL
ncbi:hypothetical protein HDV05_001391 [Chytridiales sp. JEL 0842]|nr:hypothetical protein HDV05_001391 [Chytridiales sp. JEL 0842]